MKVNRKVKERQPKGKLKKTKKWMRGNQNLNETQPKMSERKKVNERQPKGKWKKSKTWLNSNQKVYERKQKYE